MLGDDESVSQAVTEDVSFSIYIYYCKWTPLWNKYCSYVCKYNKAHLTKWSLFNGNRLRG